MLGLRTVVYKVPNLAAAIEWYSKAFNKEPYFNEPFYAGFSIGGYELGLMPYEEKPTYGDNSVSYWGVKDIDESYAHLLSLGGREHEAPYGVGGELRVASVYDPWDNIVGIIYNPYFKTES